MNGNDLDLEFTASVEGEGHQTHIEISLGIHCQGRAILNIEGNRVGGILRRSPDYRGLRKITRELSGDGLRSRHDDTLDNDGLIGLVRNRCAEDRQDILHVDGDSVTFSNIEITSVERESLASHVRPAVIAVLHLVDNRNRSRVTAGEVRRIRVHDVPVVDRTQRMNSASELVRSDIRELFEPVRSRIFRITV